MPNMKKVRVGDKKGPSAGDWNGFIRNYKHTFQGSANQEFVPTILHQSTIVNCTLVEGADPVEPFSPCRVHESVGRQNSDEGETTYEVTHVTQGGGFADWVPGTYGFTLGEGVSPDGGGRVVIAGIAIVALTYEQVHDQDGNFQSQSGGADNQWYNVPDLSISYDDGILLGPTGHFKMIGWTPVATSGEVNASNSADSIFLAVDMNTRPSSIIVKVRNQNDIDGIPARVSETELGYGFASPFKPTVGAGATMQLDIEEQDTDYGIYVYNTSETEIKTDSIIIAQWSVELNRFIVDDGIEEPCFVMGKNDEPVYKNSSHAGTADADIDAGSAGEVTFNEFGQSTSGTNVGGTDIESGDELTIHVLNDCSIQFQRTLDTNDIYQPRICEIINGVPVYPDSTYTGYTYSGAAHAAGEVGPVTIDTYPFSGNEVQAMNVGPSEAPEGSNIIIHLLDDCSYAFVYFSEEENEGYCALVNEVEIFANESFPATMYTQCDAEATNAEITLSGAEFGGVRITGVTNYGGTFIPNGQKVIAHMLDDCTWGINWPNEEDNGKCIVPLLFTKTGGLAGDDTTECTFTYTVNYACTGDEEATAVNPTTSPHIFNRHGVGECIPAEGGYGYINGVGNLVIIDCTEKLATEACT